MTPHYYTAESLTALEQSHANLIAALIAIRNRGYSATTAPATLAGIADRALVTAYRPDEPTT